ncbi:hypothetical protein COLO4_01782 [Corchorus olitorius]|uniref:Uncharacterized protein n=1 Tax=Corchorus olitorius TaxID=93759 RepID=A0A1R3L210_9ROSI|nr:hypothetical protein COLO4_01782 [Corchorus olitorius]
MIQHLNRFAFIAIRPVHDAGVETVVAGAMFQFGDFQPAVLIHPAGLPAGIGATVPVLFARTVLHARVIVNRPVGRIVADVTRQIDCFYRKVVATRLHVAVRSNLPAAIGPHRRAAGCHAVLVQRHLTVRLGLSGKIEPLIVGGLARQHRLDGADVIDSLQDGGRVDTGVDGQRPAVAPLTDVAGFIAAAAAKTPVAVRQQILRRRPVPVAAAVDGGRTADNPLSARCGILNAHHAAGLGFAVQFRPDIIGGFAAAKLALIQPAIVVVIAERRRFRGKRIEMKGPLRRRLTAVVGAVLGLRRQVIGSVLRQIELRLPVALRIGTHRGEKLVAIIEINQRVGFRLPAYHRLIIVGIAVTPDAVTVLHAAGNVVFNRFNDRSGGRMGIDIVINTRRCAVIAGGIHGGEGELVFTIGH